MRFLVQLVSALSLSGGEKGFRRDGNGPKAMKLTIRLLMFCKTVPPQVQTVRLPVDHFNSSNPDTYLNRFWVNSKYYKPGGPVVIFNNGERGVHDGVLRTYFNEDASNMAIAKRYNGIAVVWEHRYYGE